MKKRTQEYIEPQSSVWRIEDKIASLAEPLLSAEGFELVQVQCISQDKEKILRVSADKKGGINLDDCAYISRQLSDVLDVSLENMPPYRLEVSSPGPRRPLNCKKDFYRFMGSKVKIQFKEPTGEIRKITGILSSVTDTYIIVSLDDTNVKISDQHIEKAMLSEG